MEMGVAGKHQDDGGSSRLAPLSNSARKFCRLSCSPLCILEEAAVVAWALVTRYKKTRCLAHGLPPPPPLLPPSSSVDTLASVIGSKAPDSSPNVPGNRSPLVCKNLGTFVMILTRLTPEDLITVFDACGSFGLHQSSRPGVGKFLCTYKHIAHGPLSASMMLAGRGAPKEIYGCSNNWRSCYALPSLPSPTKASPHRMVKSEKWCHRLVSTCKGRNGYQLPCPMKRDSRLVNAYKFGPSLRAFRGKICRDEHAWLHLQFLCCTIILPAEPIKCFLITHVPAPPGRKTLALGGRKGATDFELWGRSNLFGADG